MEENGTFFGTFKELLSAGQNYFTQQNQLELAKAQIQAETVPATTTVVTAPANDASVVDTKPNTLLFAGIGLGAATLLIVGITLATRGR